MRLLDLAPKLSDGQLRFRCPLCGEHQIVIPVAPIHETGVAWGCRGTLEDLTVTPSIRSETPPKCLWHGYVRGGLIETLPDSKLSA